MTDHDPGTAQLLAQLRTRPTAMLNFARTFLLPRGRTAEALEVVEEALAAAPDDAEVRALAQDIRSRGVGAWYFTMVQDADRHTLYETAFARLIPPGATVLDIGSGTGLFAMMAAKAGAGHVVAAERHPAVAAASARAVADNGLDGVVDVIAKSSTELEVGRDLPQPADVLVWDNLANNILGAGALATIEDARRRLLAPGAVILPAGATMHVALVEDLQPADREMGTVHGLDLSALRAVSPAQYTSKRRDVGRRSEAAALFAFDFTAPVPTSGRARAVVRSDGGRVSGVLQWARFDLGAGVEYDTSAETVTAFGAQFHRITPFDTAPGEEVAICGAHDGENSWLWVDRA